MKGVLFVILFVAILATANGKRFADPTQNLTAIKERIQSAGVLSADTIGDQNAWNYMAKGLNATGGVSDQVGLNHLEIDIVRNDQVTELFINASAFIWEDREVGILVIFFYSGDTLEFYFQFYEYLDVIPPQLVPESAKGWYGGLDYSGCSVAISSTSFSFNDVNFNRGLTLTAFVQSNPNFPIDSELKSLTNNEIVKGSITAYFPLSTEDPLATFTFDISSPIYFAGSKYVHSTDINLVIQVTTDDPTATLTCDLQISDMGGVANQNLNWVLTADATTTDGFTFNGQLEGTWSDALGLKWLSFTNLDIQFQFVPDATNPIEKFTFNGETAISFSANSAPTTVQFYTLLSNDMEDLTVTLTIPVGNPQEIFNKTIGTSPPHVGDTETQGDVQITISTSSYQQYQPGLTIAGNLQILSTSKLANSVKTVYSSSSLTYTFNLYIPVFSPNPQNIDFTLTESGAITISSSVTLTAFMIHFTIVPAEIAFSSTLVIKGLSNDGSTLTFIIAATVDPDADTVDFDGQMQGTWNNPFGLDWLTLTNLATQLNFQNGELSVLQIQGTIDISWGDATSTSVTVALQGPQFTDWAFSFTVVIEDLYVFLTSVVKESNPPQDTHSIIVTATVSLASYAQDGIKQGLSLSGSALILPTASIGTWIQSVAPNGPLNFAMSLYIPLWSEAPYDVSFSLSESGYYQLKKNVLISSVTLIFDITPTPEITLDATGNVTLSENPTPLIFSLSSNLDGISELSMKGSLQGDWPNPFGYSWLTMTSVSGVLTWSDLELTELSISATASFTFLKDPNSLSVTLQTSDDLFNVMFEVQNVILFNYGDMLQKLGYSVPSQINDLDSVDNTVSFIISTYDGSNFIRGLTLMDSVQISGDLVQDMKVFNVNGQLTTMTFTLGLVVPIFSTNPNMEIYLKTSALQIRKNLELEDVTFQIDTSPYLIELSSDMFVNFTSNPELEFGVNGEINGDGSIQLGGDMVGTWTNMFGINGLQISNVEIALGMNPSDCVSTFCISALGLGYNITMGSRLIAFYGYGQIPDIGGVFLEGELVGPNGMALTVYDIAYEWNVIVGNKIGLPIDLSNIPQNWGLENMGFYIAPEAGTFNNINYQAGFWMYGGIVMFNEAINLDIVITSTDFEFHLTVNTVTFQQALQNEVDQQKIVTVNNVTLSQISFNQIAHGIDPLFYMDYDFLGHQTFQVRVPLENLYWDFATFFDKYLGDLFN